MRKRRQALGPNIADVVENLFNNLGFRQGLSILLAQIMDTPSAQDKYYALLAKFGITENDLSKNDDDYLYDEVVRRVTNTRHWID